MRRIIMILLAFMSALLIGVTAERVNASESWILWKQVTEVQPDREIVSRWFVQTALTEYAICYDMALRLADADRKTLNRRRYLNDGEDQ